MSGIIFCFPGGNSADMGDQESPVFPLGGNLKGTDPLSGAQQETLEGFHALAEVPVHQPEHGRLIDAFIFPERGYRRRNDTAKFRSSFHSAPLTALLRRRPSPHLWPELPGG